MQDPGPPDIMEKGGTAQRENNRMSKRILKISILGACMAVSAARAELKSVLVYTKTVGFRHDKGILDGNFLIDSLGKAHGFTVIHTENPDTMKYAILKKFDVVVFNNTTRDVLPLATQQTDFIKYLNEGGGWVGFHGAMDHGGYWQWYADQGANFIGEQFDNANINVDTGAGAKKPEYAAIMATVPKTTFQWRDGWYFFSNSARHNSDVLLTLDENTPGATFVNKMGDHPIAWAKSFPKLDGFAQSGRYLYVAIGHGNSGINGTHCFKNEPFVNEFVYQSLRFTGHSDTPTGTNRSRILPTIRTGAVSASASQIDVAVGEDGPHSVQLLDMRGRKVDGSRGNGPSSYVFSGLNRQSIYVVKVSAAGHEVCKRVFVQ